MKPSQVTIKNEAAVWDTLYGKTFSTPISRFTFKVGDKVRISKVKKTFEKGYTPNWSREMFTIAERLPRRPPVYRIKDYDDEILQGVFYEQELQKVQKEEDLYQIESIIKKRKLKGKEQEYFLKWRGYGNKFNS